jgi:hypothetical protein
LRTGGSLVGITGRSSISTFSFWLSGTSASSCSTRDSSAWRREAH